MRVLRTLLLSVLIAAAVAIAALLVVLGTESGTRQALQLVAGRLAPLTIGDSSGSLLTGVHVTSVRWHDSTANVHIRELQLQLAPGALLAGEIQLPQLIAAEVSLEIKPGGDADAAAEPAPLPTVALPLALSVHDLHIQQLRYVQSNSATVLELGVRQLRWAGPKIDLQSAALALDDTRLQLSGDMALTDAYPLAVHVEIQDPRLPGAILGKIEGSLEHLELTAELTGREAVTAQAAIAALSPGLPFSLRASVPRAIALTPEVTLQSGGIDLQGNIETFSGELQAQLQEHYFGSSRLQATITWQDGELSLSPARWQREGETEATLALNCTLTASELSWRCDGDLRRLPLDPWLAQRSAAVSASLAVNGQWQGQLQLDARLANITGNLGADTLQGELHMHTDDGEQWRLQTLRLASNGNRVAAAGEFGLSNALQLTIDAPQLQHLYPPLTGALAAELKLSGTWPEPSLEGHLRGRDLHYADYALARLDSSINLRKLGASNSRWQAHFAELALGERRISGTATASGNRERQQLALNARDALGNALQLRCEHTAHNAFQRGNLACPQPTGTLGVARETIAWTAQPIELSWSRQPAQFALEPLCLNANQGRLCLQSALTFRDGELQPFHAALTKLPLAWPSSYLPYPLQWDENAEASLQFRFLQQSPLAMTAELSVSDTNWRWPTAEGDATGTLRDVGAEVKINEEQAVVRAHAGSSNLGELDARLVVYEPMAERRLDGELQLHRLQLGDFAWLVPQLTQLEGQIDGRLQLGGNTAEPTLTGQVQLREGAVATPMLAEAVEGIALDTSFSREQARFNGRFQLGGGSGALRGEIRLPDDGWQLDAQLDTQSVAITPLPDSSMTLSSTLTLQASPDVARLKGQVTVERADIQLRELPPDTQDVSDDAVIVGEQVEEAPLQLYADIGINLGEEFHFKGFGAEVDLAGKLRVHQQPGQALSGRGEVVVSEGRYRAYGQRLTVREGSFLFDGPLDNPDLRLEAIREMPPGSEVVVGVRVTGPLQNPSAELFSEPPRPETETAYYLLTGRPPAQFGQATQMSAESALLAIGLAGSNEKAAKVAKRIGIEDFQIGTATGEQGTEAQASGYLSSRLYVRYGTGISQRSNTVTFQYRLTDKLLLEAVSGIEQALDLLYSFSID